MALDIVKEFLSPKKEDEFPHFYAKMNLYGNTYTYDLRPKGMFKGVKKTISNGKVDFIPDDNWYLKVDGKTGYCKIPDIPYNRKRFKLLCQPKKREVIEHVVKQNEEGEDVRVQVKRIKEEPALFSPLEQRNLEKQAINLSMEQLQAIADRQGIEIIIKPKNKGEVQEEPPPTAEPEPEREIKPKRSLHKMSDKDNELLLEKLNKMEEANVNNDS